MVRSQVLVGPTGTLFWRPLDVLLFRRARNIFSQLFRQFRILNCNLSDSLKNLPTLLLLSSEQKLTGGISFTMQFPMATVKKNSLYKIHIAHINIRSGVTVID
jgi:hypothetical protein